MLKSFTRRRILRRSGLRSFHPFPPCLFWIRSSGYCSSLFLWGSLLLFIASDRRRMAPVASRSLVGPVRTAIPPPKTRNAFAPGSSASISLIIFLFHPYFGNVVGSAPPCWLPTGYCGVPASVQKDTPLADTTPISKNINNSQKKKFSMRFSSWGSSRIPES